MTLTRCQGRTHPDGGERFYDKKLGACPLCGTRVGEHNSWLYTAKLNGHLWDQAAKGHKEMQDYRALQKGYEIPPPKWAKKAAREIVSNL
ncbi:MAG: hypothetical protein ACYC9L_05550 [Sulfuricaulis sp.]